MYTVWLARIHPQSALSHVFGPSIKTKQNRLPLQSFLRRTVAGCYTTSVVKNGATKSMWQHWACVVNIFHTAFLLACSENFVLRGDVACIPAAKWLILDLTGYARMASSGDLKRVFTDQGPYFQSTFHAFEGRLLVMGHLWGSGLRPMPWHPEKKKEHCRVVDRMSHRKVATYKIKWHLIVNWPGFRQPKKSGWKRIACCSYFQSRQPTSEVDHVGVTIQYNCQEY